MQFSPYTISGLLLFITVKLGTGFYIQPEVLFLSEHPLGQYIVADSDLYLSCGVQLRGLEADEGGLYVPSIQWRINSTTVSMAFPDEAMVSTALTARQYLRSTLHIEHTSSHHSGTYHCNVVDGTDVDEGMTQRLPPLCVKHECHPFITASNPALITVLENSTTEEVVEVQLCSSTTLHCGSLLTAPGLRPVLEWAWNGTTLYTSSESYNLLSNGDLVLYHSVDGGIVGTFHCIARSDSSSATMAMYRVIKGDNDSSSAMSSWLVATTDTVVEEDGMFSLHLASSGLCLDSPSVAPCVWTRDNIPICSNSSTTEAAFQSDSRYKCQGRMLTISQVSHQLDTGRYCCEIQFEIGGNECIDIHVTLATPAGLTSPFNGTTLTTSTSHPSQFTLSCTPTQPYTSYFWLYNGVLMPSEQSGEVANVTLIGVYQCSAGNQFGYTVVTLRIVPAGITNPPGQPQFCEIPRPDHYHRPAYIISWQPPNYPSQLNDTILYSLSTIYTPTLTSETSVEIFIPENSYTFLNTIVLDGESREELSDGSPALWRKFNDSFCHKQVYFPPRLTVNCSGGVSTVTWSNNPDNEKYYQPGLYSSGANPGLYYINVTCYLPNSTVFETGGVFTEEGYTVFDEGLPYDTECVFKGAATPATGHPAYCLDPSAILYDSNYTCQTTAHIDFVQRRYWAQEGDGFKEICLMARGYDFSVQLNALEDSSTEVIDVRVSSAGGLVCVNVTIQNDEVVNRATYISLSLQADTDRVSTGHSVELIAMDNDELHVEFTNTSYEVVEGGVIPVCLKTDDELGISVVLHVFSEDQTGGKYTLRYLTLDPRNRELCFLYNVSDNSHVEGVQRATVFVETNESDVAVDMSPLQTTVNIYDNDKLHVKFTNTSYEVIEGGVMPVCMRTDDDLRQSVILQLFMEDSTGNGIYSQYNLVLGENMRELCVLYNASDNTYVEGTRKATVYVESSDGVVDSSALQTTVNIHDDDELHLVFTNSSYEVVEGGMVPICVRTDDDLRREVFLVLYVKDSRDGEFFQHDLILDGENTESCVLYNASDDTHVEEMITASVYVESSDVAANVSALQTTLIINNNDVAEVSFVEVQYVVTEGSTFQLCVKTEDDLQTSIQLDLRIDGADSELLNLPQSFMLGPNALHLCLSASSQDNNAIDNSRMYMLRLESNDTFIDVPGSGTVLLITNDDVLSVGFTQKNYEMQAGEQAVVCVVAVGDLRKSISVSLSAREVLSGMDANHFVELAKEESLEFFPNNLSCVLLNASRAITEETLLVLELTRDSGEEDVSFSNDTAYVTITPAPAGPPESQQTPTYVIVVSVLIPLVLVLILIVVCAVLLRYYCITAELSMTDIKLPHEKSPLDLNDYTLEPHFGSVSTIFEGLEPQTIIPADSKVGTTDLTSLADTSSELHFVPEPMLERAEEGGREGREEAGKEGDRVSSEVTASRKDSSNSYSHSDSVSSISHHEYIASDSIMFYSCPPSVIGGSYPRDSRQATLVETIEDGPENDCAGSLNVEMSSGSVPSHREHHKLAVDMENSDSNGPSGDDMDLFSDEELSAFFGPVVDSGIGMDIGENET